MTDKPIVWGKPPSDNISLDECEWYHAMEIPGIGGDNILQVFLLIAEKI